MACIAEIAGQARKQNATKLERLIVGSIVSDAKPYFESLLDDGLPKKDFSYALALMFLSDKSHININIGDILENSLGIDYSASIFVRRWTDGRWEELEKKYKIKFPDRLSLTLNPILRIDRKKLVGQIINGKVYSPTKIYSSRALCFNSVSLSELYAEHKLPHGFTPTYVEDYVSDVFIKTIDVPFTGDDDKQTYERIDINMNPISGFKRIKAFFDVLLSPDVINLEDSLYNQLR